MTVNELRGVLIDDSPSVPLTEKGRQLQGQADEKTTGHDVRLSPKECRQLIELLMKI